MPRTSRRVEVAVEAVPPGAQKEKTHAARAGKPRERDVCAGRRDRELGAPSAWDTRLEQPQQAA